MEIEQKAIKKQVEEWLDRKYMITCMAHASVNNTAYYNGAVEAIRLMGYKIKLDIHSGKHTLWK